MKTFDEVMDLIKSGDPGIRERFKSLGNEIARNPDCLNFCGSIVRAFAPNIQASPELATALVTIFVNGVATGIEMEKPE